MFDWCFRRVMAGHRADLLEVRDGARLAAGSAVTYRNVHLATGELVRAGIMTASFTMPFARGQKRLLQLIERSLTVSQERGCSMLLAFVTETNASRRRLQSAGATLVPSFYCRRT